MSKISYILIILLFISLNSFSQETTSKLDLSIGSDFMSRYVWRGVGYGKSPSIQPSLALSSGSIELGAWGAYTTNGLNIQEIDLYLTYNLSDAFSVTLTDYFFPNDNLTNNDYFEYDNIRTGHLLELLFSFNGLEKYPVSILGGVVVYGADKINYYSATDTLNTNSNFSTYLELGYSGSTGNNSYDLFMGFATHNGLYGTAFGIVNLGITGYKDIKLNDFVLPISCSFIINPQMQNIFLVFGLSL